MRRFSIERMKELYQEHEGCHAKVAKDIGCTREYVRQQLNAVGMHAKGKQGGHKPICGPRKYTEAYLRDLYEKGEGRYFKMAELAGVTPSVISGAVKRIGLQGELKPKTLMGRPRKVAA